MTANINRFRPFRVGVNTNRLGRLGSAPTTQQEVAVGSSVIGAASGAAIGAAAGSVVPGIGTAIGFAVGVIADALIHTGQGPQRLAQANAIDQALAQISTANHQGAAIPWNGTASAPGLLQFISALMTAGLYMSWDPSVESSPSVNGNWSTCFQNAVIAVTKAIVANATGAAVTVPIVISGVSGSPTKQFTFNNPGISVGPDVIAASIIMGNAGLMYWIIISIGESAAHATANANNAAAQKVFALMVDHAAYDAVPPPPPAPPPSAAPLPVANQPAPAATLPTSAPPAGATTQVVQTGTTSSGTPVVDPNDTNALIAQLIAQGQTQEQALAAAEASLEANGINSQTPQVQQQLQAAVQPGMSTTTLLIVGGVALGAILLMKKS